MVNQITRKVIDLIEGRDIQTVSNWLKKFKNLKIYIRFYGDITKDLNFISNVAVVKDFNISDDPSQSLKINFMEIKLTLATNKITINHNNQVDILNGVNTSVSSNATILKITGERIYY